MLFHIQHTITYTYGRPVFLEPMTLRLTPRQDANQRLLGHRLAILPTPAGQTRVVEPDGTDATISWFEHTHGDLVIEMEALVQTLRDNPFDWIVTDPAARTLPASYSDDEAQSLGPSLGTNDGVDVGVASWARDRAAEVGDDTAAFLIHLADQIHQGFEHVGRPDGDPQSPGATLRERRGACRDTAMLFVEACRSLGLACRFVSGYSMHHPPEVSEHELHAWAEVYLPGAGWRGYDPSLGLAVADGHVVLAATPDHRLSAPVTGRFRGTGATSRMDYDLTVRAADTMAELSGGQAGDPSATLLS
ncbi:MAG: transglutaminase family protein [Cyanobacteriota bacterium]|nr:transglutaminase family protein [Cyanobacteriota bacterium]